MTNEQINISIAEACGWTIDERIPLKAKESATGRWIPDYCNDLNAMHEAEKVLIEKCKEGNYWFHLREILEFPYAESDWDHYYYLSAIHATAKERAEAFLRTFGKVRKIK